MCFQCQKVYLYWLPSIYNILFYISSWFLGNNQNGGGGGGGNNPGFLNWMSQGGGGGGQNNQDGQWPRPPPQNQDKGFLKYD